MNRRQGERGFTLVELIVVIIVIAILAALAIPNFTSSAQDAKVSTLAGDLAVVRNAISLYYHQHDSTYPGAKKTDGSGSAVGAADLPAAFEDQLTLYTDADGKTNETVDPAFPYGPYLVKGIPTNPVVGNADVHCVNTGGVPAYDSDQTEGWIYDYVSGQIISNDPTHGGL